jgi:hypothetical protein
VKPADPGATIRDGVIQIIFHNLTHAPAALQAARFLLRYTATATPHGSATWLQRFARGGGYDDFA